jgi:hypothetical protein
MNRGLLSGVLAAAMLAGAGCSGGGGDGGGGGGNATTNDFPVNEAFAAALVSQGMTADAARYFAAAKLEASCSGDTTTCTYRQTYPNGATRDVTVTAANQQYTPTANELALTASEPYPVYDAQFAGTGISESSPPTDTQVGIGYFVPAASLQMPMSQGVSASITAYQRRVAPLTAAVGAGAGANGGVGINWTEVGKKGADVSIGSVLDHYKSLGETIEATGNVYKVASLVADASTALSIAQQTKAWLAELDELQKCAANPTNSITQTDPNYSASTVAALESIRAEIIANGAVRLLNQVDETSEGFYGGQVMAVLSIPMKQGHVYTDQTLQDLSNQYMQQARSAVVSCKPVKPANLVATPASETQIDLSWSGSIEVPASGYRIYAPGLLGSTSATSYSDTGLSPSTTYCYVVSAFNEYGESDKSAQACATTLGPPVVHGTTPYGGAKNVAVDSTVTATFSEAMDPATISISTFTLSGPGGAVAGTVSYSGLTATFTPSAALEHAKTYTATVTTGAKDLDGNPMQADYTWDFTTAPAQAAGNLQWTMSGDSSVSGYANVTWTLFDTLPDVSSYYATGDITADITLTNCDPVHISQPIAGGTAVNPAAGGRLDVFNGTNSLWPNRYKFEVHTVAFDQTFQCGTPRQPLTIPGVSVGIAVGPCNLADGTVPYTDASNLAGQWSCASQAMGGNMFFGSADATWDFKDFK